MNDLPRPEDLTMLRVLEEIAQDPATSQRRISRHVGVSLGLTNLIVHRLLRKAWIKISTIPGRRVAYALTPRGMTEKIRKTRDFVRLSLRYFFDMKGLLVERLRETGRARPRVGMFGPNELAPVVEEAAKNVGGRFLGPVDGQAPRSSIDVVVLLGPARRGMRAAWEREGLSVVDLS